MRSQVQSHAPRRGDRRAHPCEQQPVRCRLDQHLRPGGAHGADRQAGARGRGVHAPEERRLHVHVCRQGARHGRARQLARAAARRAREGERGEQVRRAVGGRVARGASLDEDAAARRAEGLAASAAARLAAAQAHQRSVLRALATFGGAPLACRALLTMLPSEPAATDQPEDFAASMLRLALNRSGSSKHDSLLQVGHRFSLQGDHASALATYQALAAEAPRWAEAHARMAVAQHAIGEHDGCVAAAAEASRLNPSDVWNLLQRGLCLKELKQTELALALFRQVAELHPRMPALRKLRQWMSSAELAEKLQKQRAAPPHATDSS
eukprot:Transcript_17164.p2 GENE.Transcript_17164~~Transcript_17164.p2  ORF type:complete len:324 (-),score=100.86 Transcript_17164:782-1753(-)